MTGKYSQKVRQVIESTASTTPKKCRNNMLVTRSSHGERSDVHAGLVRKLSYIQSR